ncbi:hypothetical protein EDB92DRAFT_1877585 [Lactarius akahatsu]|uniref:CHAT domain-containing protein n=1 Tax=Lactarius akahatsu TaxID=416441 RepID=A0AAD4LGW6_9AGAM|nr:hypothetical protein EDB92DRAFT_1877585 [Lactarius akahatsu]
MSRVEARALALVLCLPIKTHGRLTSRTKRMRPPLCVGARETSSELHGSDCLTLALLDFVRSRLTTTELAFLSACHTARMKDRRVAYEAPHLTSATVQAIADVDGRDVAEHFYTPVFPPNR